MAIRAPRDTRRGQADEIDLTLDGPVDIEELWEHRAALHQLCARIVGDPVTADDMVQETYLRALRNLDKLERRPSLMPWLATVARRRSLDELRSRSRSSPFEVVPDTAAHPSDSPDERVQASETVSRVRDAFGLLNARERRLLTRQIEEGLSLAELAAEDNSSVDAVRSVLVRARTKLRHAIGEEAVFPAAAPFGALGLWLRRRTQGISLRVQEAFARTPLDRLGEVVTAGVVSLAVGAGPAAISATGAAVSGAGETPAALDTIASAAPVPAGTSGAGHSPTSRAARATTALPAGLPGGAAVELLLPPDDVETPEDAQFESLAVTSSRNGSPVVLAAGHRLGGCAIGCTVLFRSDDGGRSWYRLPARGITGASIAAAPAYPDDPTIFAMGGEGLSVSRDGGQTFERIAAVTGSGPLAISPAFSDGDERVFIGTGPALVWDDRTQSARPLVGGPAAGATTHFAFEPGYPSGGGLFVGSVAPGQDDVDAAVYRCGQALTEDSCVNHTALRGLREAPNVAVAGSTVFAWTDQALLRSTDHGASFTPVALPGDVLVNAVVGNSRGGVLAAVHRPSGSTPVGVLRSADGGATWRPLGGTTRLAAGVASITVLPDGTLFASPLAVAGGGIMCSSDGGSTWGALCA